MINITQGDNGFSTIEVEDLTPELRKEGWRACVVTPYPETTDEQSELGFYRCIYTYDEKKDIFLQSWEYVTDLNAVAKKIARLKQSLTDTDYVIVKTYEARLVGDPDPYSQEYVTELVADRQKLRAEVNRLTDIYNE